MRAATGMQRSSGGSAHDARAGASSGAQVALHPSPDAAWAGAGCGAQSLPRLATPLTDTWSCDELASRGEQGLPICNVQASATRLGESEAHGWHFGSAHKRGTEAKGAGLHSWPVRSAR